MEDGEVKLAEAGELTEVGEAEALVVVGEVGGAEVLVAAEVLVVAGEVEEAEELVEEGVLPGEAVLVLQKLSLYGRTMILHAARVIQIATSHF